MEGSGTNTSWARRTAASCETVDALAGVGLRKLGDPMLLLDEIGLESAIVQEDFNFPRVIGVDHAGGVRDDDRVLRIARPRATQNEEAGRRADSYPRWDEHGLPY